MAKTLHGRRIFPTIFYRPPCVIRRPINPVLVSGLPLYLSFLLSHIISPSSLRSQDRLPLFFALSVTVLNRTDNSEAVETVCYTAPKKRDAKKIRERRKKREKKGEREEGRVRGKGRERKREREERERRERGREREKLTFFGTVFSRTSSFSLLSFLCNQVKKKLKIETFSELSKTILF